MCVQIGDPTVRLRWILHKIVILPPLLLNELIRLRETLKTIHIHRREKKSARLVIKSNLKINLLRA